MEGCGAVRSALPSPIRRDMSPSPAPRFIYFTASTLNGFLADESHSLSWLFAVESDVMPEMDALMPDIGVNVMGSSTYEWVLREERVLEQPGRWSELAYLGSRTTFVFSSRDLPVPGSGDVRIVRGSVPEVLIDIRAAAVGKIVSDIDGVDRAGYIYDVS